MVTIKLKYNSSTEFQDFLKELRKHYSSVHRFAYNRLQEGKTKKEIYHLVPQLNNINLMKPRMITDAIDCASKNKQDSIIYGGKNLFIRRCKGLITKEQWKEKRLLPLYIQGEKSKNGNRYFEIDIFNKIVCFKYSKDLHFDLSLYMSKNQMKSLNGIDKFTVTLDEEFIRFSFNPVVNPVVVNEKRYVGIDLNPSSVGISILDDGNILDTYMFDFHAIKNENKLKFELFDICKRIDNLSKHYQCKFIFMEDLTIKSKDHEKGKRFNRDINAWKRNLIINNLEKRCWINGQRLFKINPCYSSVIGNLQYNYVDPVNASIEIARRGYNVIILKNKQFYPAFWLKELILHQWKETGINIPDKWNELFVLIKNLKLSYRVSLDSCSEFSVFRKKVRIYEVLKFS